MVPFRGSDKEYAKQIETLAADQYSQFFSFGTCDWEKLPRLLGQFTVRLKDCGARGFWRHRS